MAKFNLDLTPSERLWLKNQCRARADRLILNTERFPKLRDSEKVMMTLEAKRWQAIAKQFDLP